MSLTSISEKYMNKYFKMVVLQSSSNLIGRSIINHPILRVSPFMETTVVLLYIYNIYIYIYPHNIPE